MDSYGPTTFIWTGVDHLQAILNLASPRATAYMGFVIEDVLTDVFEQSQLQVPVDTGALRSSGHVDPLDTGPSQITGTIGYGAPYAFHVHEDLRMKHPHGGKAKYLEDPMREALNSLSGKTAERLAAVVLGQGAGSGSKNMSAQSMNLSRQVGRRSLARRGGISAAHIGEALRMAESHQLIAPGERPTITVNRGRLHEVAGTGADHHAFEYEPPKHPEGELFGRIPRNPMSGRQTRRAEGHWRNTMGIRKRRRG